MKKLLTAVMIFTATSMYAMGKPAPASFPNYTAPGAQEKTVHTGPVKQTERKLYRGPIEGLYYKLVLFLISHDRR